MRCDFPSGLFLAPSVCLKIAREEHAYLDDGNNEVALAPLETPGLPGMCITPIEYF